MCRSARSPNLEICSDSQIEPLVQLNLTFNNSLTFYLKDYLYNFRYVSVYISNCMKKVSLFFLIVLVKPVGLCAESTPGFNKNF